MSDDLTCGEATVSSFDRALKEFYLPQLQAELKRDLGRTLFWDGTYGPPDPRPFYGPPEPPDTACGDIGCRCCAEWREREYEHCC